MVGAPTLRDLKIILRHNIIHNLPVTVEDIEIVDKIFGPDVSSLKGITTIQRPKVVMDNFIYIPRELIENNQEFILCMDIMFINQQALLTTIEKFMIFLYYFHFPIKQRKISTGIYM